MIDFAPGFPRHIERRTARQGRQWVRELHAVILQALLTQGTQVRDPVIRDQVDPAVPSLEPLLSYMTTHTGWVIGDQDHMGALEEQGNDVSRHAEMQIRRRVEVPTLRTIGGQTRQSATVREWAREAAARIVVIEDRHRALATQIITQAHEEGWGRTQLARELRRARVTSEKRANLWARDQIGTLNATETGRKQQAAGLTHYRWRTSRDERVRELHRDREDLVFAWDDPPRETRDDGHPGRPINCRCTAEPVIGEAVTARGDATWAPPNPLRSIARLTVVPSVSIKAAALD